MPHQQPVNYALQQRNMRDALVYDEWQKKRYGTVVVGGVEVANIPELVRLAKISCGECVDQQGETPDHQLFSMESERAVERSDERT